MYVRHPEVRSGASRPVADQFQVPASEDADVVLHRSLWLIRGDEGYGVRRATLGMAAALLRRGVQVGFASLHAGAFADEIAAAGYPLWLVGDPPAPAGLRRGGLRFVVALARLVRDSRATRRRLCRIIGTFNPDWIHLRINALLLPGGSAGRATGVPVVWHLPNTIRSKLPFHLQALGTQLLCRALGVNVLANSGHTARSLGNTFCRVRVVYPGIDATHFSPNARFSRIDRDTLGIPAGTPVAVVVARVIPDKAQDRLVEAVIELDRRAQPLALLAVGGPTDTDYYRSIEARLRAAHAENLVRLIGPVADPRPYFEVADFVINSRTGPEPFGLTVVEAMLMQRPVLAYALGGPAETVVDGTTGWLVHDPSVDGYRRGLERALADRAHWAEFGRNARAHALAHFSIEQTTTTYLRMVLQQ